MYMGVKAESGGKTQCHAQLLSPRDYMITSRTVPVRFVDTLFSCASLFEQNNLPSVKENS